jgi:signal transduction histidine kinase
MTQPDAIETPPPVRRWAAFGAGDNRLVRAIARAPANVRTKLVVAFLVITALLVLVGIVGLRFLGQSNSRVEGLGSLQKRASTYQALEAYATDLRGLLAERAQGEPGGLTGGPTIPGGTHWNIVDASITYFFSQVELASNEAEFGFVPPPAEERVLARIRGDYRNAVAAFDKVKALDAKGAGGFTFQPFLTASQRADDDLSERADALANRTSNETSNLIAANHDAYTSSRDLFIGVAAGSVVLALGLGLVLAWSLSGPIRRTEARLEEIAAGDFSGHLDVPNRDELGSLARNVNRMNDELRRLYGELEAASRHKSEFLANMSHELRTPLNAIIGFSEVLHERMFGELNEQQLGYVEDVLEAGRHLLLLINDVLDLSKIEAGRMELELTEVSLPDTLQSGLTMHEERAGRSGVALGLVVVPETILVEADERKLRQVVFNLLSNAVKFTPAGGRVDVSARLNDGLVEVAVTDTGPGIAPEEQDLIFEVFQQARSSNGDIRSEGTGLGLPLSRRFIELHGGRLWVESTAGEGSTFRFTLPAKQEAGAA